MCLRTLVEKSLRMFYLSWLISIWPEYILGIKNYFHYRKFGKYSIKKNLETLKAAENNLVNPPAPQLVLSFFFKKNNQLFLAALGLCCCPRAFSSCSAQSSHCGGFSCCGATTQKLWCIGFSCLRYVRSSTIRDRTLKPMSPALAGRFFTTEPPASL